MKRGKENEYVRDSEILQCGVVQKPWTAFIFTSILLLRVEIKFSLKNGGRMLK